MAPYLAPLGNGFRYLAALACTLAAVVFFGVTALLVAFMVDTRRFDLASCVVLLIPLAIGVLCGWLAVRLWRGRTGNGVTVLPVWFIEAFGVVFLAGVVLVALTGDFPVLGLLGLGVPAAMLTVRYALRRVATASSEAREEQPAPPDPRA